MSEAAGAPGPWGQAAAGVSARPAPGFRIPYIDHIWRVRGAVPVDPALSPEEAFARLGPLLGTPGTDLAAEGGVLAYAKHNPAAQDPFATFTRGRLWIERAGAGAVLRFELFSHALLLCFLAPLLFLGFAQLAVTINDYEKAAAKAEEAASKDKKKDEEKKDKPVPKLNPIDEFLGAPAPEDPAKKKKDKKEEEDEGRHSPEPGYFLAGLFAALYLLGRWLEPWLARRRFRAALASPIEAAAS
ncbi:hypothetical protein ACLBKU_14870 [Erythrobacter sp. NE805]|uniref:hypothetical protein n=1 Tax=Erythrobacter sp. NE805 TaxID=3389875 RepID=UPI00396B066D